VHLVWAPLGPQSLARFLDSFRRHDPGVPHSLLVLFNGFEPDQDRSPWRRLLEGIEHEELLLDRAVMDLEAYRQTAKRVPAERYCFVNSHSLVRSDGWLGALERALLASGTGIVGASGSWGSIRSYQRFMLGFGGPYAKVFADRRATNATLAEFAARQPSAKPRTGRDPLGFARALLEQSYGFVPFPAPHLRTNAFMIRGDLIDRLRVGSLVRKSDVYRLESGRASITAQVEALGLTARVVGRDGVSYVPSQWPSSETFWQGEQANLLVADNQTVGYQQADHATRQVLARFAWGSRD
jgi:hypothetical protein